MISSTFHEYHKFNTFRKSSSVLTPFVLICRLVIIIEALIGVLSIASLFLSVDCFLCTFMCFNGKTMSFHN